jgi:hypothetical protein
MMLERPCRLMPRKLCGRDAEMMALIAASRSPSVAFLKPTGVDSPLAISRCVCDSEVRAPMAVHDTRSPRYCGEIGSSASVAAGRPSVAMSSRKRRARRMPSSMRKLSSMKGSLM